MTHKHDHEHKHLRRHPAAFGRTVGVAHSHAHGHSSPIDLLRLPVEVSFGVLAPDHRPHKHSLQQESALRREQMGGR